MATRADTASTAQATVRNHPTLDLVPGQLVPDDVDLSLLGTEHCIDYLETVEQSGLLSPSSQTTTGPAVLDSGGEYVGLATDGFAEYECSCGRTWHDRGPAEQHLRHVAATKRWVRDRNDPPLVFDGGQTTVGPATIEKLGPSCFGPKRLTEGCLGRLIAATPPTPATYSPTEISFPEQYRFARIASNGDDLPTLTADICDLDLERAHIDPPIHKDTAAFALDLVVFEAALRYLTGGDDYDTNRYRLVDRAEFGYWLRGPEKTLAIAPRIQFA